PSCVPRCAMRSTQSRNTWMWSGRLTTYCVPLMCLIRSCVMRMCLLPDIAAPAQGAQGPYPVYLASVPDRTRHGSHSAALGGLQQRGSSRLAALQEASGRVRSSHGRYHVPPTRRRTYAERSEEHTSE